MASERRRWDTMCRISHDWAWSPKHDLFDSAIGGVLRRLGRSRKAARHHVLLPDSEETPGSSDAEVVSRLGTNDLGGWRPASLPIRGLQSIATDASGKSLCKSQTNRTRPEPPLMPQDPGVSVLSHASCRHDRRQEGHGSFPLKCHQETCGPIRSGFRVRFLPSCSLSIHCRLSIRYRSGLQGIEEAFHRVRKRLIPVVTGCILGRFDHSGTKPDSFER